MCVKNNYLKEKWLDGSTEKFIYYYYDESGVSGFNFNGTDYHYQKNILGDIIAIYDVFGNKICYYKYDAWGNHRVFDGSTNLDITNNTGAPVLIGGVYVNTHTHIGNLNSFRYRGYYYDTEIGMYYLQTRYYDPQVGRFINADEPNMLLSEGGRVGGTNLHAYCGNNPVMHIDNSGKAYTKFKEIEFWSTTSILIELFSATGLMFTAGLANNLGRADLFNAIASFAPKVSNAMQVLGYATVALGAISNAINNYHNGADNIRIATDFYVDIGVGVATIWASAAIGTAFGSFVPIIGNAIGAIVGVGVGLFMYFEGDKIIDTIKDTVYNVVVETKNWVNNTVTQISDWLFGFLN